MVHLGKIGGRPRDFCGLCDTSNQSACLFCDALNACGLRDRRGNIWQPRFFGCGVQRRNRAIQLDSIPAQVLLLRETAIYYWMRTRLIGDWWIQWALSLAFWLFLLIVVLAILSIYMPIIAIITGLTGGGFGF